jgi:glycosyltransferase involved in cell wall biosynthesis
LKIYRHNLLPNISRNFGIETAMQAGLDYARG